MSPAPESRDGGNPPLYDIVPDELTINLFADGTISLTDAYAVLESICLGAEATIYGPHGDVMSLCNTDDEDLYELVYHGHSFGGMTEFVAQDFPNISRQHLHIGRSVAIYIR